ncbi:unnamed protein product [Brassica napus]|uniref:(rape) hypothetical protein n=1 Tax=Brassica napus TaxID=3708 RepID=A0A816KIC4_BRANA|nr:unnamed protein product [Brassica napus]
MSSGFLGYGDLVMKKRQHLLRRSRLKDEVKTSCHSVRL